MIKLLLLVIILIAAPYSGAAQDKNIDLDLILEVPPADESKPSGETEGGAKEEENPLDRDFTIALEAYRERDYETARQMWSELSDAGHGISMHNLAVLKWRGQGGPRERSAALELFKNAGEVDVGPSLHALGVLSLKGVNMPADPAEAVRYFEAASVTGHLPSTYNLALAHLMGIGGADDQSLGMELMEAAAEGGLARAQYDLGNLLYQGTYSNADKVGARLWFERAAENGDPFGYYNLALMQLSGEGGEADPERAVINLTEAAEMGAVPAQLQLAHILTEGGPGVSVDPEAAYFWFSIAGTFGAKNALENAKRLSHRLDAAALKRARTAAASFKPKQPIVADPGAQSPQDMPKAAQQ